MRPYIGLLAILCKMLLVRFIHPSNRGGGKAYSYGLSRGEIVETQRKSKLISILHSVCLGCMV